MLNRKWSPKRGQASLYSKAQLLVVASLLALGGCGDKSVQTGTPTSSAAPATAPSAIDAKNLQALQEENQRLKAEVTSLKEQVADLGQTPQVLLDRVQELVKAESLSEAKTIASKLEQRYGPDGLAKTAKANVAQLESKLEARKEQARQLEARGFYALKPSSSVAVNGFVIKVDSLGLGNRWLFNTHDYQYNYRDVQRGEKFVLLKTTLQNTNKSRDPNLPDIAIYAIEGKAMRLVASVDYEWLNADLHGT